MYDLSCVVGTEGSKNDCLHTEDAENSVADQARKLDNSAAPSDAAGLEDFQRAIDFQFMLGSLGSCSLILVDCAGGSGTLTNKKQGNAKFI